MGLPNLPLNVSKGSQTPDIGTPESGYEEIDVELYYTDRGHGREHARPSYGMNATVTESGMQYQKDKNA